MKRLQTVCMCLHVLSHIYGRRLRLVYILSICVCVCLQPALSVCSRLLSVDTCDCLSLAASTQRRCSFNKLGATADEPVSFFLSLALDDGWSTRRNHMENIRLFRQNCASRNNAHKRTSIIFFQHHRCDKTKNLISSSSQSRSGCLTVYQLTYINTI